MITAHGKLDLGAMGLPSKCRGVWLGSRSVDGLIAGCDRGGVGRCLNVLCSPAQLRSAQTMLGSKTMQPSQPIQARQLRILVARRERYRAACYSSRLQLDRGNNHTREQSQRALFGLIACVAIAD